LTDPVPSRPQRQHKWRRLVVALSLFCAVLGGGWLALRESSASKTFMEGCYSEWAPGSMGSDCYQIEFRAGRFERLMLSHYFSSESSGTYEVKDSVVTLRYEPEPGRDKVMPSFLLHYRNVGGVAVLISEHALPTYEKTGKLMNAEPMTEVDEVLHPGKPNFYVRGQKLGKPNGQALALLGYEHPDFLMALPEEMRQANTISRKTYLRYRWEAFLSEHPELEKRLVNWIR
jgi:hypothetical protein